MRKSLFALLALLLTFPAVFAQTSPTRQNEYKQLLKERQELLSWSQEHPLAPRFLGMMKEEKARDIRKELYSKYFDLRKKEVSQFRQELRRELQKAKNVPYITFNRLPAENLKKMARHPKLLLEFLKLYPDNAATLSDAFLTKLFKQHEDLEKLMMYYLVYLKSYNANPSCAAFSKSEKQQLSIVYKGGNLTRFYENLSLYATANLTAQYQKMARAYVKKSLVGSLKF